MRAIFFCLLALVAAASTYLQGRNIYQKITLDPDLAGFNSMLKNRQMAKLNLNYAAMTIFAPDNAAVDDFNGHFTDDLVLYHMGFEVRTLKTLTVNNSMPSGHADNPPLWLSRAGPDYYVNNAKIIESKSNYVARSHGDQSKRQVLHVIDRVLDPMVHTPYPNATACTFLSHHYKWKIGQHTVQEFLHKVQQHQKEDLYRKPGGHTFFVPVDHRMDDYQLETIDSYIIEGHVVPNVVLFTRPTNGSLIYETAANGDHVYIVLSMNKNYVTSYTVLGNSAHRKGEILAEIVKADIPLLNGVVHLIKQPLAVFKRELKPFPYLSVYYKISADPTLSRAYEVGRWAGFDDILKNESIVITYFAPKNGAWDRFRHYNPDRLADILGRHIVVSDGRLTATKLAMKGGSVVLNTLSGPITLTLETTNKSIVWNKKKIAMYRADYECTNGVVHVVDGLFEEEPTTKSTKSSGFWKKLKDLVD